ncbi:hypothetical protein GH714_031895 [Hevea brasiliensis]|uniref:Uncharacterized protein n=1 Tax=Hevea brasiliensis TaxID=3981 RepID=A0A6A6LH52_HEVBR|nr:hypothetical protein GH714_031895 [Hevea brasiliensis]
MGRSPCCEKVGLKKGPWTPEEDQKLLAYIEEHGHGSWRALPAKAGLQRCGKSCRLRWWSAIATHLPKRTDNEIKNYWNTHLKKRLAKMGIDPVTHKPKMMPCFPVTVNPRIPQILATWLSGKVPGLKLRLGNIIGLNTAGLGADLESPTSTVTVSENAPPQIMNSSGTGGQNSIPMIELVGTSGSSETGIIKEEGEHNWKTLGNSNHHLSENSVSFTSGLHHSDMTISMEGPWTPESLRLNSGHLQIGNVMEEGFTTLP